MDEKSSTSQLETDDQELITIRQIELSDVDDMMVWLTDDRVRQYNVWDTYTTRDQALDYIKNLAIPHPWSGVICIDNKPIGSVSLTPLSGNNRCRAELAYVLGNSFWGQRDHDRSCEDGGFYHL